MLLVTLAAVSLGSITERSHEMAYQDSGMLELANPQLASILRQRRFAEQLMQSGVDASPIQHPLQGLSRLAQALMGGFEARSADSKMDEIGQKQEKRRQEYMSGMSEPTQPPLSGMPAMVAGQNIPPPAPVAGMRPFTAANLPNGIDSATDQIVRTVWGEAAGEPPEGQRGVAAVIQNRMKQSGQDATSVIFKPNQFEPWNNPATRAKLEKLDPNSPEYQRILANIAPVLGGVAPDPTNGATHFYSPTAQTALGRETPSWATGQAQDIGRHRFYNIGYQPGSGAPGAPGAPASVLPPTMVGATSAATPGIDVGALQSRAAQLRATGNAGLGDPDSVIRSRAQGYLHEADRLDRLADQERVRVDNRQTRLQDRADAQADAARKRREGELPTGYQRGPNGEATPIPGVPVPPNPADAQGFTQANALRDEFGKLTADFRVVQSAFENIRSAAKANDGAGDMSLLYSYVKLLDPTSVVRESEFATAAASGSFGERVQGAVARVLSGARMPETLRDSFIREAKNLYGNQRKAHDSIADQYERLAKRFNIEPDKVVTRFARPQEDEPSEPPPEVVSKLSDGIETKFGNGQVWTMQGGKPVRVK